MATSTPVARVSAIQGQAQAKAEDGSLRPLRVGDFVYEGEIIVAGPNTRSIWRRWTASVFSLAPTKP